MISRVLIDEQEEVFVENEDLATVRTSLLNSNLVRS